VAASESLRIGCVKYLNARPLIQDGRAKSFSIIPASCATSWPAAFGCRARLKFRILRNPVYTLVDGVFDFLARPVHSVFLAHVGELKEIEEIEIDPASQTSVNLLRCSSPMPVRAEICRADPAHPKGDLHRGSRNFSLAIKRFASAMKIPARFVSGTSRAMGRTRCTCLSSTRSGLFGPKCPNRNQSLTICAPVEIGICASWMRSLPRKRNSVRSSANIISRMSDVSFRSPGARRSLGVSKVVRKARDPVARSAPGHLSVASPLL